MLHIVSPEDELILKEVYEGALVPAYRQYLSMTPFEAPTLSFQENPSNHLE